MLVKVKSNKVQRGILVLNKNCLAALKYLNPGTNPPVPWHRVINSSGTISSRGPGTDGARRQRDALVAEGVTVTQTRDGEFKVDFSQFGWFPDIPVPAELRDNSPGDWSESDARDNNHD